MSGLAFLLIVVLVSTVGIVVLWMRNRGPTSIDYGVEEFRREMNALSPDNRPDDRRPRDQ
jgi:hypothetical protein